MSKATLNAGLLAISLDRTLTETLQSQLVRQLRDLILKRTIAPGAKLPSSRSFADELSVSRVTITAAIDQLASEGYVEGRHGSGVYVESHLPDYVPETKKTQKFYEHQDTNDRSTDVRPFDVTVPDLVQFPFREWSRLHDRVWRDPEPALLARPDPFGWFPLRLAISEHLREWRGIVCRPEQIAITGGIVEAIGLVSQAVLNEGDTVYVEDPGYAILRQAIKANGQRVEPVPVDEHGFDIGRAVRTCPAGRVAAVTPSRQYPLGMVLPLARRLELLEWSGVNERLIIEDDYDSEFRFQGRPLPALMSLQSDGRVLYMGSFSKVLFPGLRLGFVVLPEHLLKAVRTTYATTGVRTSLMLQPVLARFIADGHFATHIRRMRRLYAKRQRALIAAVQHHANDLLEVSPSPAGMNLIATFCADLARKVTDLDAAKRAERSGVSVRPLSSYYAKSPRQQGFVLGYAGFDEPSIESAARKLTQALKKL